MRSPVKQPLLFLTVLLAIPSIELRANFIFGPNFTTTEKFPFPELKLIPNLSPVAAAPTTEEPLVYCTVQSSM